MYTELSVSLARTGADRTFRTFELTGQFPVGIAIAPGDADSAKWAESIRQRVRGKPPVVVVDGIPSGEARLCFEGSDGALMLTIETLRRGKRESVRYSCTDDPPAWAHWA